MTTNPLIAILSILVLSVACAPQAELVRTQSEMTDLRQDVKTNKTLVQDLQKQIDQDIMKRLDVLDANVKGSADVQKVMADYGAKTDQLTTDLQLLQGKLEENNFRIAEFAQKLDDRSVKIAELSARIDELETKVKTLSAGTSTVTTGESTSSQKTIEPSETYRQAKSDYDRGHFDLALAGFQYYIVQFPNASMIDNAQYWVGECQYSKKEYSKAIDAFTKVIKNYPKSDKVAGAKLKIGLSYMNEKNYSKAKEYLHKVIKEHPSSNEAAIAKDRLAKIER